MDAAKFDAEAMGRLAKALTFICGADHPCVAALAKAARTQFLRLKPGERRAALTMLSAD